MLNEAEKNEVKQLTKDCLVKDGAVKENVDLVKLARLKALTEKAKLPAEEKGSAPENPSEDKKEPEKKPTILSKIKLDEIGKLPLAKLKEICDQEHLPGNADQDVLVKIVRAKKLGGDKQVINNNTLCKYCKFPATVINSEVKQVFQDKTRVIRYRLKCSGPRTHKFTRIQSEKATVSKEK